jgi:hypothetical protein
MLDKIANGGEFDAVAAVRVLATELIKLSAALAELLPPQEEKQVAPTLAEVLGNSRLASALAKAGFATVEAVRNAPDDDLLAVSGVNEKGLAQIREKLLL